MTDETMGRYFDHDEEYAVAQGKSTMLGEILPFGVLWSYVSSSFANAFLNCGEPRHAVLLNRYAGMDENDEGEEYRYNGQTYTTKRQALNAWQNDPRPFHLNFEAFGDDVLLVNHLGEDAYLYIWLDCDVSDCCVGRFRTSDRPEQIEAALIASAVQGAKGYGHEGDLPVILDVSRFKGWLSF